MFGYIVRTAADSNQGRLEPCVRTERRRESKETRMKAAGSATSDSSSDTDSDSSVDA